MFEDIKRPRAEMKVINSFISEYETAKRLYKEKKYSESLGHFETSFDILTPIYDKYPKVEVLFFLMKTKYHTTQYHECLVTKNKLIHNLKEIEDHKIKYPKFWAKIFFYEVVIAFIQNNLKECIQHMLNLIDYAKNNHDYTLEDKIDFFFVFLKGILKCGNITTTKKYELFKKEVDGMVVEIDDDFGDKKKMLTNRMKDIYKNFLSTKIRKFIFDELNNVFFKIKYNLTPDNKVVGFLDKKMHICVRDNNMQKFLEIFETYLHLNKINLKDYFGKVSMKFIVNEQKNRIETFDTIYGNLCGAFGTIFEEYFTDAYTDPLVDGGFGSVQERKKSMRNIRRTFSGSLGFKSDLSSQAAEIFQQIKQNSKLGSGMYGGVDEIEDEGTEEKEIKRASTRYRCSEFDFGKDIYIPPNQNTSAGQTSRTGVGNNAINEKKKPNNTPVGLGGRRLSSLLHPPNQQMLTTSNNNVQKTQYSAIPTQTLANLLSKPQTFILRNVNNFCKIIYVTY